MDFHGVLDSRVEVGASALVKLRRDGQRDGEEELWTGKKKRLVHDRMRWVEDKETNKVMATKDNG